MRGPPLPPPERPPLGVFGAALKLRNPTPGQTLNPEKPSTQRKCSADGGSGCSGQARGGQAGDGIVTCDRCYSCYSVLYWFRSCPRAVRAGCSLCFHVSPPPGLPSLSSRSSSSLLPSVSSSTCSYARFVRLPFASLRFSSVPCRSPSLHGSAVSMVRWSSLPDPPLPSVGGDGVASAARFASAFLC